MKSGEGGFFKDEKTKLVAMLVKDLGVITRDDYSNVEMLEKIGFFE